MQDRDDSCTFCDFGGSSIDGSIPQAEPDTDTDTDFQRPSRDDNLPDVLDGFFNLGTIIFETWPGRAPSWNEFRVDDPQRFPDLTGAVPGGIMIKCYQSATEITTAPGALREETNACTRMHGVINGKWSHRVGVQSSKSFSHTPSKSSKKLSIGSRFHNFLAKFRSPCCKASVLFVSDG